MKRIAVVAIVFALLAGIAAVGADNPAFKGSKYIWVQTEQYQAGKEAAYMKMGQVFKQAMSKTEFTWLAGMPIAGNGNEVTYVTFHDNYASVEKMLAAFMKMGPEVYQKEAALMSEGASAIGHSQSFIAEFQPDLSFATDKVPAAQCTRWRVTTLVYKPGMTEDVAGLMKEIAALHQKAGEGLPGFVYRVVAGEPSPAYMIVSPLKTLADIDEPSPALDALLTPLMKQHLYETLKKTTVSLHTAIYVIDPRLSLPPKSFLAENPGFWTVKEPPAVVAKGKKGKKAVEPAAIKEKEKK